MAEGGLGSILPIAALGVGAYVLYNWWQGQQSAAGSPAAIPLPPLGLAPGPASAGGSPGVTTGTGTSSGGTSSGGTSSGGSSSSSLVLPSATAQLLANNMDQIAGLPASGQLPPDAWYAYYIQIGGGPALPGFPSGSTTGMTALQWVQSQAAGNNYSGGNTGLPGPGLLSCPPGWSVPPGGSACAPGAGPGTVHVGVSGVAAAAAGTSGAAWGFLAVLGLAALAMQRMK